MRMAILPMAELSGSKWVSAMSLGEQKYPNSVFFLFQQIVGLFLESIHLWKNYELLERAF